MIKKLLFSCLLFTACMGSNLLAQDQKQAEDSMLYYYGKSDFVKAIFWGEKNAELVKQKVGEEDTLYGQAVNNLASCYDGIRNYKVAKPLFRKASEIFNDKLGQKNPTYLFILTSLAKVSRSMGDYQESDSCFQSGLKIQKEISGENTIEYAALQNELAWLYRIIGKYQEAEDLCNKALQTLKEKANNEHPDYLATSNNLASVYYQTGRFALTEKIFLEIAEIKKRVLGEDALGYADALNQVGAVNYVLGNYESAALLLYQALFIYENKLGKTSPSLVGAMGNLGAIYQKLEYFDKAKQLLHRQIALYEISIGKNTVEYANALNNLAQTQLRSGKDSLTEELFNEALTIRKKLLGTNHFDYIQSLSNLALYYTRKNKFSLADSLYKETMQLQENVTGDKHPDYVLFANNQCELFQLMRRYRLAAESALKLLPKEEELLRNKLGFQTESELIAYIKSKEFSLSIPYSSLFHFNDPKLAKAAYNNQLLLKGIAVHNSNRLFKEINESPDSMLVAVMQKFQKNKSLLNRLLAQPISRRTTNTDSLSRVTNLLEKELVTRSSTYKKQKEQEAINWQQVQQQLQPTEAAIEFVRFRYIDSLLNYRFYYGALFVNKKDTTPIFIKLFEETDLKAALKKFPYKAAGPFSNISNSSSSQKNIYQLLWQPLMPYLTGISTIYFAPDGLLHNLSFAAIANDKGALLCDKYNLIQLTSTREVALQQENKIIAPASIVLFGGINYNKQSTDTSITVNADPYSYVYRQNRGGDLDSFFYLPATLSEVSAIKKNMEMNAKKTTYFTGDKATEAAFRSISGIASPKVIHFATHAFSLPDASKQNNNSNSFKISDNPLLRSGLVLAGGNKGWKGISKLDEDDGILTALEITSVSLQNTQLAVLSACETGIGELKGSEGIFGLQRAFKLAGVNYIMASLWQVPDKETGEFMNNFYSNWLAGKNIRQAFITTQQAMRKKYAPFYWAAFTLVQ